jgi:hypothetical protein
MTENKLLTIVDTLDSHKIFFGPQGFIIANTSVALTEAQYGFGQDEEGNDLSGSNAEDWQPSWVVIARDTELGDPYFVDVRQGDFPVYTAFLGESGWETEIVATSLLGFVNCMNLLNGNGKQTEAQFVPDENTIVDDGTLNKLQQQLCESAENKPFWQMFFRCYQDWLVEE